MLTLAFNIRPVKASGTIYIRADGSIDPPTTPIATVDNVTYTFTDNINDSIVVERDSIVVDGAGYRLRGSYQAGINLVGRSNVTVRNIEINSFSYGIYLESSSGNSISGNNIVANTYSGIQLYSSDSNSISGNNITNNPFYGIYLESSSGNSISGNNVGASAYGGIRLYSSSNSNSISGNNITNNMYGVWLTYSSDNSIIGNNMNNLNSGIYLYSSDSNSVSGNNMANGNGGIYIVYSPGNTISGNNITANGWVGIELESSSNGLSSMNSISGNNITGNNYGIRLYSSSDNSIFHNNFFNNAQQVYSTDSVNVWDNGYPSGGNYWSDYTGTDLHRGPYQNETGSDGIGDTQYSIDSLNTDRYPLKNLWARLLGDINGDEIVDIYDAILLANAYNSTPGKANWNPNADINGDNIVDIYDAIILASHFNQHYP